MSKVISRACLVSSLSRSACSRAAVLVYLLVDIYVSLHLQACAPWLTWALLSGLSWYHRRLLIGEESKMSVRWSDMC